MAIARKTGEKGKQLGLWIGLSGFLFLLAVPVDPTNGPASRLAAVALLMAVWWVTDAIPLFATAMLPLVLFPLLGIMTGQEIATLGHGTEFENQLVSLVMQAAG